MRGRHHPSNLITEEKFNAVTQLIRSVERLPSHYDRRGGRNGRQFIDACHSISSLFRMYEFDAQQTWQQYRDSLPEEEADDLPLVSPKTVKYQTFRRIFRLGFPKLSFRRPKVDGCRFCMRYASLPKDPNDLVNEERRRLFENHRKRVAAARLAFKHEQRLAIRSKGKTAVIQLDMQRNLEVCFQTH